MTHPSEALLNSYCTSIDMWSCTAFDSLFVMTEDMPYAERKSKYAQVGRLWRAPGVDSGLLNKYEMMLTDGERPLACMELRGLTPCLIYVRSCMHACSSCRNLRFEFIKSALLDPSLASITVEDCYKSISREGRPTRTSTSRCLS